MKFPRTKVGASKSLGGNRTSMTLSKILVMSGQRSDGIARHNSCESPLLNLDLLFL